MAKNKHFISKRLSVAFLGILCALGMGAAAADSSLQAVVQSYTASSSLQTGMIVKLAGSNSTRVEPVTADTAKNIHGVVVPQGDAPVTLAPVSGTDQQVYVATSGRYEVLVSNQNGTVNAGDYITVSSLDGIGMKAATKDVEIVGRAASSFDGVHGVQSSTTVKDSQGKSTTVSIARIPVDIAIGPNPDALKLGNVPGILQHAGILVAGKPVTPWRLYISAVLLLGVIIIAGSLLYSGVRSSMVAIGRNPLAKSSITRNLIQVVFTSITIFIIGVFGVYLLLKL